MSPGIPISFVNFYELCLNLVINWVAGGYSHTDASFICCLDAFDLLDQFKAKMSQTFPRGEIAGPLPPLQEPLTLFNRLTEYTSQISSI